MDNIIGTLSLPAARTISTSEQIIGKVGTVKGKTKQGLSQAQLDRKEMVGSAKINVNDDLAKATLAVKCNDAHMSNIANKFADKVKGLPAKQV